jgi:hypothetical protein
LAIGFRSAILALWKAATRYANCFRFPAGSRETGAFRPNAMRRLSNKS